MKTPWELEQEIKCLAGRITGVENSPVDATSVATYAEMLTKPEGFYKVITDENSGDTNVVYYWDGVVAKEVVNDKANIDEAIAGVDDKKYISSVGLNAAIAATAIQIPSSAIQVKSSKGLINKVASPRNVGNVGIIIAGIDSLTDGASSSDWRRYIEPVLRGKFGDCGPGYHGFNNGTATDRSVTFALNSMSYNTITGPFGAFSIDGRGIYSAVDAPGLGTFSWQLSQKWDTCRVFYLKQPSGGTFKVRCTNVAIGDATLVNTSHTENDLGYLDISYVGTGNIGISGTEIGANVCIFGALFTRTGIAPVSVLDMAAGGRTLASVAGQNSSFRRKWLTLLNPSHFLFNAGMNDRISTNAATHYTHLETVVNDFQAVVPNCNIAIVQSNDPTDATITNFASYTSQKIALAKAKGLSYLDLRDALGGGYAYANSESLMADGIHPNDTGNRLIARSIADHLGLPWLAADPGRTAPPGGGGDTSIIPAGNLTPKRFAGPTTVGTTLTLWTLGLGQLFPSAILTIRVNVRRSTTDVWTVREYRVRISNTNVANTVTSVSTVQDTLLYKELGGDSQGTEITFSCAIVSGKAVITVTPLTQNWGVCYATASYVIATTATGQQVVEN